jgi:hypothetical protein
MAVYTPSRGERPDGLCACGQPATTEIQTGWHNPTTGVGGGQYEEMCDACFAEIAPKAGHRLDEYGRIHGGTYHGKTPAEVLADRDDFNRICGE